MDPAYGVVVPVACCVLFVASGSRGKVYQKSGQAYLNVSSAARLD